MEMIGFVMILLLGTLGGVSGGSAAQTTAPHDSAVVAAAGVLPDALFAAHADVGVSMSAVDTLIGEVEGLQLAQQSATLRQTLKGVREAIEGLRSGLLSEIGLDIQKQIGSVTLSVATVGKDDVRLLLRVRGDLGSLKLTGLFGDESKEKKVPAYKGIALHPMPDGGSMRDHVVARPDDATLVIGPRELVQDIIAKKAWKGTERSASTRIGAMVDTSTWSFVYIAPAAWMEADLSSLSDRPMHDLVAGIDYALYTVASAGARGRLVAKDPAFARRVWNVAQAFASLVAALDPLVDAAAHGAAGVLPWVARRKAADTPEAAQKDEQAVMEAGAWAKKRLGGEAEATLDEGTNTVELTLSNPTSLTAFALPGFGVAMWGVSGMSSAPPSTAVDPEFE